MSRRYAVMVVTLTYVAVTVGESILAPVLPFVAPGLGLDVAGMGRVLGALSLAAAVGNLAGGALLGRRSARVTSLSGAAFSALGSGLATVAGTETAFLGTQVLIGLGAGLFYAGGVFSITSLTPPTHTGRAMGAYGVAYSVALGVAAALVTGLGETNWQLVYAVSAVLALVVGVLILFVDLPGATPVGRGEWRRAVGMLGAPVLVGAIAAIAQFGLVVYIPAFGVENWALSATAAAAVLFVGRMVSIPGKYGAGWMIDRLGVERSARLMGAALFLSGLTWILVPTVPVAIGGSVVFATAAGALFPMANVVAVKRFGELGGLLGVFRSVQMGIAALSVAVLGLAASAMGMRPTLALGSLALLPVLLLRSEPAREASIRSRN